MSRLRQHWPARKGKGNRKGKERKGKDRTGQERKDRSHSERTDTDADPDNTRTLRGPVGSRLTRLLFSLPPTPNDYEHFEIEHYVPGFTEFMVDYFSK